MVLSCLFYSCPSFFSFPKRSLFTTLRERERERVCSEHEFEIEFASFSFFPSFFLSALRLACLEFVMHCDSPHACCDRYEPFQNPGLRFSEECWGGGGNRSYGWDGGWLIDYCAVRVSCDMMSLHAILPAAEIYTYTTNKHLLSLSLSGVRQISLLTRCT